METERANIKRPACPGCVERDRRIAALEAEVAGLQWAAGEIEDADAAAQAERIEARLTKLVRPIKTHAGNERLAAHLQMSVLTTCRQRNRDPITHLALTLRGQPPPLLC